MTPHEGDIALNLIPGIGFVRYMALLEHFGSAEAVFAASRSDLEQVPRLGRKLAEAIAAFDAAGELERELAAADKGGVRIFTLSDPDYPEILRDLSDPPLCIYWRGRLPDRDLPLAAIVGSRRVSSYGARMTSAIAADAAAAGFGVVSGLALGADTLAHQAAVEAQKPTFGVIGAGMVNFYPQDNLELARRMIDCGGAVLSEFPLNFPILRENFPRRNRIVAALCRATIVTEAGLKSGALITARLAAELGREVFAVPGHADNPQAQGCHRLIKEGAGLIESFADVLETLGFGHATEPDLPGFGETELPFSAPPAEVAVMKVLNAEGEADLEKLHEATGFDTGDLLSILMTLELKSLVERGNDQRYRPATGRKRTAK